MEHDTHVTTLIRRPREWLSAPRLALVVSVDDPEGLSRVQVRLVGCDDTDEQDAPVWARVVCPFAGQDRGAFLIPDVDDEVLVVFQNGDPSYPLVLGGLWNGSSTAPAQIGSDGNRLKRIRSKNGVTVTLDDQQGQEQFIAETPGGQRVTLRDGPGTVVIEDIHTCTRRAKPGQLRHRQHAPHVLAKAVGSQSKRQAAA